MVVCSEITVDTGASQGKQGSSQTFTDHLVRSVQVDAFASCFIACGSFLLALLMSCQILLCSHRLLQRQMLQVRNSYFTHGDYFTHNLLESHLMHFLKANKQEWEISDVESEKASSGPIATTRLLICINVLWNAFTFLGSFLESRNQVIQS